MNKVVIFAGTTEGRKLSEYLADLSVAHTVCVATEYGELVMQEHALVTVHCGRMDQTQIYDFLKNGKYNVVVDATHPYAKIVTQNIKAAVEELQKLPEYEKNDIFVEYYRLERDIDEIIYDKAYFFEDSASCAESLEKIEGNILLTTGSKDLSIFSASENVRKRLFVRVLPGMESLKLCIENGISGRQILALQGPFSRQMNEAMIAQYDIKCLVTKQSGKTGGTDEKIEAAKALDIPVFVIGQRDKERDGYSLKEICRQLGYLLGTRNMERKYLDITLAGVGMGSPEGLTGEVKQAISHADIVLGAKRLIDQYNDNKISDPCYLPSQIIPYLKMVGQRAFWEEEKHIEKLSLYGHENIDRLRVVILFSGDSGFYSGCKKVYEALKEEISTGGIDGEVQILPGISSVAYFAACIGESYQDGEILSIHGKQVNNLVEKIRRSKKTFLLMSGVEDVKALGEKLMNAGLEECEILAGYQLSYPEQEIFVLTSDKCKELTKEGLYVCCIRNPKAEANIVTPHKKDADFIRGKVPMTKEEIRQVSICKLHLKSDSVVYDVGSGTGSIAVEMAAMSDEIQVYAIEKKEEAVGLIKENKKKFGLENIEVIMANAPEGLEKLPTPTHAFIGGSGGNLKEIVQVLFQKNPKIRIVINAISLETICELKELLTLYPDLQQEMVQMQVSRSNVVGAYHLMQAENPVWICTLGK